MKDKMVIS